MKRLRDLLERCGMFCHDVFSIHQWLLMSQVRRRLLPMSMADADGIVGR